MTSRKRPPAGRVLVPEAELELLAALQRLGESEAVALREAVSDQRPLAHTSVVTLLRRLEARGLVQRRRSNDGRAYLYSARGPGLGAHFRRLASRLFGNDRVQLVSALFDGAPPDQDELAELAELVESLRKEKRTR
ncbi:MAG TPA: BlaI/MecI/CopY family transcriptional regulator [Thermoanaerobaculia bacterium]|nr:BlaI/MecI/CopY family transcriptional regulator [Thermoanaerobaculia bacterium]